QPGNVYTVKIMAFKRVLAEGHAARLWHYHSGTVQYAAELGAQFGLMSRVETLARLVTFFWRMVTAPETLACFRGRIGGGGGIRTPGPRYTDPSLAVKSNRPLWHASRLLNGKVRS